VVRLPKPRNAVAFADEINDPDNYSFSTKSGKIELYASMIADAPNPYGLGDISPIPVWNDHLCTSAAYPLSYCSSKSRARTHSIHGNQDRLARVDPDNIWLHPTDAEFRNIADGDEVLVSSPYGATRMAARVTEDIAIGVASIKEGAWFSPGDDGVDVSGCANILTKDSTAPSGAMTYNSNAVEVRKV
ncbi:MAG: molybdopterin dinucleotide binding domain-containing protein, partial [Alphaproteobacteria bacterium]